MAPPNNDIGDSSTNAGSPHSVDSDLVQTGNFVFADGLICAERMLRAAVPPTAIFASNDDMAAAAGRWRVNSGWTCRGSYRWPDSTTRRSPACFGRSSRPLRQPVAEMARIAADLIIQFEPRRNGWPERIPRHLLDHELVIRNSTARPARR